MRFQVVKSENDNALSDFYIWDRDIDDVVLEAGFDRGIAGAIGTKLNTTPIANLFLWQEQFWSLQ